MFSNSVPIVDEEMGLAQIRALSNGLLTAPLRIFHRLAGERVILGDAMDGGQEEGELSTTCAVATAIVSISLF